MTIRTAQPPSLAALCWMVSYTPGGLGASARRQSRPTWILMPSVGRPSPDTSNNKHIAPFHSIPVSCLYRLLSIRASQRINEGARGSTRGHNFFPSGIYSGTSSLGKRDLYRVRTRRPTCSNLAKTWRSCGDFHKKAGPAESSHVSYMKIEFACYGPFWNLSGSIEQLGFIGFTASHREHGVVVNDPLTDCPDGHPYSSRWWKVTGSNSE